MWENFDSPEAKERSAKEMDAVFLRMDKRLGRAMFELDQEEYIQLAAEIVSDKQGRTHPPGTVMRIGVLTILPMVRYYDDQPSGPIERTPSAKAIMRFFGEVSAGAYALGISEEWEDLDAAGINRLIDNAERGQEEDPEEYMARVIRGTVAELDGYEALSAFVEAQPATARLDSFAERFSIQLSDAAIEALEESPITPDALGVISNYAWRVGVVSALFVQIDRLPASD